MQPRHTTNVLEGTTDTTSPPPRRASKGASAKSQSQSAAPQPQPREKQKGSDRTVDLTYQQPNARSVCVAGTFNNWDQNKTPMRREGQDPVWKVSLPLKPGRYEYRFVVDGQWTSDPNAKETTTNDFGSTNSVLVV